MDCLVERSRVAGAWIAGCAFAVILASAASPARATVSQALSLSELVNRADLVVVATCVDHRASWDERRRIVTDYSVRVDEALKGDISPGEMLTMRRLGGVLGDLGMRIEGEPHLETGQRYLLFLRIASDAPFTRPVGMSQGVMTVNERQGSWMVQPGGSGLTLMERARGGQLVPAPPALLHPEPLDRLRQRVEGMIGVTPSSRSGTVAP